MAGALALGAEFNALSSPKPHYFVEQGGRVIQGANLVSSITVTYIDVVISPSVVGKASSLVADGLIC